MENFIDIQLWFPGKKNTDKCCKIKTPLIPVMGGKLLCETEVLKSSV